MVRLKYLYDARIQNGGQKSLWISTHNNGCQIYDFLTILNIFLEKTLIILTQISWVFTTRICIGKAIT